jgi:hypothetical protein
MISPSFRFLIVPSAKTFSASLRMEFLIFRAEEIKRRSAFVPEVFLFSDTMRTSIKRRFYV